MGVEFTSDEISEDAVLGGRLRLRQPLRGHRVGHDAILLAAATGGPSPASRQSISAPASVCCRSGACRQDRRPSTSRWSRLSQALCALAADNARLNRLDDRVRALATDAENAPALAAAGLSPGNVDRVLMNPPFNDAARQNVSPDPRRRLAHVGEPGLLPRWVASAATLLKPHGVLTLIWRADALPEVLSALSVEFGGIGVLAVLGAGGARQPFACWCVRKRARGAERADYPSLILNEENGRPSGGGRSRRSGGVAPTLDIA